MPAERTHIEVRRRFAAGPEQLFAAFAEARLVVRWLSPSPEIGLTLLQFDFREGGGYRFAYDFQGGRTVVAGRFRSIEPPSKIVFSWTIEPPDEHAGIESEVTVTIQRDGAETELVIRHEKLTRAGAAARHDQGWRGALEQLTEMLEEKGRT